MFQYIESQDMFFRIFDANSCWNYYTFDHKYLHKYYTYDMHWKKNSSMRLDKKRLLRNENANPKTFGG